MLLSAKAAATVAVNQDAENNNNKATLTEQQQTEKESIKPVDLRKKIYNSANTLAKWLDGFFGEEDEYETASYDYLRMVNTLDWQEGEGVFYRPKIRAKLHLPKTRKKISLLFSDRPEDEDLQLNQVNRLPSEENDQSSAAVNYQSEDYSGIKFDTRLGVNSSLEPFVVFKNSNDLYTSDKLSIKNFNYLFWKEEQKFGVNPKFELNRIIDDNDLFRWRYQLLRSEVSQGNEWQNTFSWVHQLTAQNWMSYDFDIVGKSGFAYNVQLYRFAIRYRTQLPIKWLYFELEPELLWLREPEFSERKHSSGLKIRLEVQFEE